MGLSGKNGRAEIAEIMDKRYVSGAVYGVIISVGLALLSPSILYADIYMYRDQNGVLHFTNVPTSPKYQIYIRERRVRRLKTNASRRYDHLIIRASEKHGVSFSLLKAIIKAESDFNPKAVSKRGAMGLMQIMPENVRLLHIKDPFDPWENIMGGTRYFKEMLRRYPGRLPLAIAAYNAGPQAVDRYNNIPPFPETRQYVKKVLRYYKAFKKG